MRFRDLLLWFAIAPLAVLSSGATAKAQPKLEWRTMHFWLAGSTFQFQEHPDQERVEDCSAENEGRGCFVSYTIRDEPCVAGTGSLKLLKRMEKLDISPSGIGQFLVETLPSPWSKMHSEILWEVSPGRFFPMDEYALVRGVRVYGPHCEEAKIFYWVRDFRILELNRYDPETGAKTVIKLRDQ